VGEGGEFERALVDVTGTGKTVPSCREKQFEKKLCKRRLNSPTVVKVFENKFGQVVEKFFRVRFVFVWLRESSEIQRLERIFGLHSKCLVKELPPLSNFIHKAKKILQSAEKPRYEFSATVLRSTCK